MNIDFLKLKIKAYRRIWARVWCDAQKKDKTRGYMISSHIFNEIRNKNDKKYSCYPWVKDLS